MRGPRKGHERGMRGCMTWARGEHQKERERGHERGTLSCFLALRCASGQGSAASLPRTRRSGRGQLSDKISHTQMRYDDQKSSESKGARATSKQVCPRAQRTCISP